MKRYTLKTIRHAETTFVACGCTDTHACDEGCSWVWVSRDTGRGLCSTCDEPDDPDLIVIAAPPWRMHTLP